MKLFISPNVSGPKELLSFQDLVRELRKLKVNVVSSIDVRKQQSERREFEEFDALVLDGSSKEADTGYYLAIALAHKKPVLYLQRKGELLDPSIESLTKKKEIKKYIKISFYSPDSFIRKVKSFLQYLDISLGKELYNIKYTLRLSPRLDRYINWKAEQSKKNKADYLRDMIDGLMKGDEEFRSRLK